MDETELMIRFTVLSFSMLSVGAVALSAVTLVGKGNRSFAIITALATVGLGAFMWTICDIYNQFESWLHNR